MIKKWVLMGMVLVCAQPIFALSETEIGQAYYRSYTYEKMGNYSDAIKSLSSVYSGYPTAYTVNLRLGYLNFKTNRFANSTAHYDNAIQALPDSIEPKLGKMLVMMTQGKYEDAELIGYQVLNLDYMNYYANLRLAFILRTLKKYELAEKVNIKMLTVYPTDPTLLTEFGALKYAMGQTSKAEDAFQGVLILDPENVDARAFLKVLKKTTAKTTKTKSKAKATTH
jgi:tetratricopeptide (TPR) repeat protein